MCIALFSGIYADGQCEQALDEEWGCAYAATESGHWQEAVRLWDIYLNKYPSDGAAYACKGYCHFLSNDFEAAEGAYHRALKLNPKDLNAKFGLCQVALATGQLVEAQRLLTELQKENPSYRRISVLRYSGYIFNSLGQYRQAEECFRKALAVSSEELLACDYRMAAANYGDLHDYGNATKTLENGVRVFPSDALLLSQLAGLYCLNGNAEQADEAMLKAYSLAYSNSKVRHVAKLTLPFRGSWRVEQGNGNVEPRCDSAITHYGLLNRFAWDFAVVGCTEDSGTFGALIVAAAPGRVVGIGNGMKDNEFGRIAEGSRCNARGNYVVVEHAPHEFSIYGHLQNGSIVVKLGQDVDRGQGLGRCGSSGLAAQPHLHFSLIDASDADAISRPAEFSNVKVIRKGARSLVALCVPEEGDIVENSGL